MINGRRLLALIPARGGSKRLPGKNLLCVAGKPLIAWSIEAAKKSKYVDRVVVSTDDFDIRNVAIRYGADVPFMRPAALSADTSKTIDAIRHAIAELKKVSDIYEYIIVLQPTSPLRSFTDIDGAIAFLLERDAHAVVSVAEVEHPVEWMNVLPPDRTLKGFISKTARETRSQDFPIRYRLNGAIYLSRVATMLAENSLIYDERSYAYVMNRTSSVDVDTEEDLTVVSCLLRHRNVINHE